jgi:hypothetical protein
VSSQKTLLYNCLFVIWLVICPVTSNSSQESAPPANITTAWQRIGVFEEPGVTHYQSGWLTAGVEVTIIERNRIGDWVHIYRASVDGGVFVDGWVMTGFLNLDDNLKFSEVPINPNIVDGNPEFLPSLDMQRLATIPILPEIHESIRDVYHHGQELGNESHVVTKIGDSLCAADSFLVVYNAEDYELGPYDYLEESVIYYRDSLSESVAARAGMATYTIFDPMWADNELCEVGEAPIYCEYRLKQPSIVFIMFGPNDIRHTTGDKYETQIRQIIEETLELGIIPVLSTFSAHPENEFWPHSIQFNNILVDIAEEYNIPIINLWLAARGLPGYGMDTDQVHMLLSGFDYVIFSSGHESRYGASLQNLLLMNMLHELRLFLDID